MQLSELLARCQNAISERNIPLHAHGQTFCETYVEALFNYGMLYQTLFKDFERAGIVYIASAAT
jgi:hypothetical protein